MKRFYDETCSNSPENVSSLKKFQMSNWRDVHLNVNHFEVIVVSPKEFNIFLHSNETWSLSLSSRLILDQNFCDPNIFKA